MQDRAAVGNDGFWHRLAHTLIVELTALPICFAGVEAIMKGERTEGIAVFLLGLFAGLVGATSFFWSNYFEPIRKALLAATLPFVLAVVFVNYGQPAIDDLRNPPGFLSGWPDAIRCDVALAGVYSPSDKSPMIFYLNGVRHGTRFGDVKAYFLTGGYTIDLPSKVSGANSQYIVHELWFRDTNGALVTPEDFGVQDKEFFSRPIKEKIEQAIAAAKDDEQGQRYILGYPLPDCGGKTIKDVARERRAFTLTRAAN